MISETEKLWDDNNVEQWINNDEGLYNLAQDFKKNHEDSAQLFVDFLADCGITETPDGAKYTPENVALVMEGL